LNCGKRPHSPTVFDSWFTNHLHLQRFSSMYLGKPQRKSGMSLGNYPRGPMVGLLAVIFLPPPREGKLFIPMVTCMCSVVSSVINGGIETLAQ